MLIFRRFPRVWELVGAWEGKTPKPTGARTYARDTCACARADFTGYSSHAPSYYRSY